jgi:16S rRNA (guanine1207-N2)-methyltransferase
VPSAESQLALANAERIAGGRLLIVGFDADVARALSPTTVFHQNWRAYRAASGDDVRFGAWLTAEQPYETALVEMPKETERLRMTLSMVVAAMVSDGRVILIGRNDAGIKSAGRHLSEIVGDDEVLDFRFHARALTASVSRDASRSSLEEWENVFGAEVAGRTIEVHDFPGVFSHGRVDEGTRRLLEVLHVEPGARVLDIGCGGGVIGGWLRSSGVDVASADVDALAIEAATRTAGSAFASDVYSDVGTSYDVIITNPPFHAGVRTTSAVAIRMIEEAPAHLLAGGEMWLVANRFLDYLTPLRDAFARAEIVSEDNKFRVFRAKRA